MLESVLLARVSEHYHKYTFFITLFSTSESTKVAFTDRMKPLPADKVGYGSAAVLIFGM